MSKASLFIFSHQDTAEDKALVNRVVKKFAKQAKPGSIMIFTEEERAIIRDMQVIDYYIGEKPDGSPD